MKNIAVLISNAGTGTNLQAIIDAIEGKQLSARIVLVASSHRDAIGLERAKKHKIDTKIVKKSDNLVELFTKQIPVDYIALAGWKWIIGDDVITRFGNRILNTHPGLIPDTPDTFVINPDGSQGLWNRGKMTLKAMQNFLDTSSTYAGCSNHFLSSEFDFGPVLGRCFEKIEPNDTPETLYSRLKVKENRLYVECLMKLCN